MANIPFDHDPPFGPAEQLANHMIHVAAERELTLTHRRLQNLLYYAQGYSLAFLQNLLFPEPIEVHEAGPVVRVVEERFACHGDLPIPYSSEMQPKRRAYHPGALLGTVLHEFEQLDDDQLTKTLRSQTHWQASCQTGAAADPRLVASWWCDRLDEIIERHKPLKVSRSKIDLKDYPEIARRVRERGDPADMLPWR